LVAPASDHENATIGEAMLSELGLPLGDLSDRTLAVLSGDALSVDAAETNLIRRAAEAWNTPLRYLRCEQLRLLVGQQMGLPWLAPIACGIASRHPNATVTFYPGDLTLVVLRAFPAILVLDPLGAAAVARADRSWIDRMREVDAEIGASSAEEAAILADRALASVERGVQPG
jgi:hypothetical protein